MRGNTVLFFICSCFFWNANIRSRICSFVAPVLVLPTAQLRGSTFSWRKKDTAPDSSSRSRDRLYPVLTLLDELDASPVSSGSRMLSPVIGGEQYPVIRNGFLTIRCPDIQVVRFQADIGTAHDRPVVFCALVTVPDPDFAIS